MNRILLFLFGVVAGLVFGYIYGYYSGYFSVSQVTDFPSLPVCEDNAQAQPAAEFIIDQNLIDFLRFYHRAEFLTREIAVDYMFILTPDGRYALCSDPYKFDDYREKLNLFLGELSRRCDDFYDYFEIMGVGCVSYYDYLKSHFELIDEMEARCSR